jgi:predicted transcriptional regulator
MKTELVTIRLNAEERARLKEIADAECNTVSGVIRRCLKEAFAARREAEALEF